VLVAGDGAVPVLVHIACPAARPHRLEEPRVGEERTQVILDEGLRLLFMFVVFIQPSSAAFVLPFRLWALW
jgi:hypothetical protein